MVKKIEELPYILKVDELKDYLRIGINQAYKLCKDPNFPSIRITDDIIRIPKQNLLDWLKKESKKGN